MDNLKHQLTENEINDEKCSDVKKKEHLQCKKSGESETESDSYFDYNLKFEAQLADKPEVLTFIIRLQEYIKRQKKKIKKLKKSLKRYGSKKKKVDISTQTNDPDDTDKSNEPKSVTEEIKEAAENALLQTGFVYEATSGMYYDYNTGYYYNAELGLYYDGNSGTYMVYNSETKSYDYHSQVDVVSTKPLQAEQNTKRKKQLKHKKVKHYSVDGLLRNFSQLSIDQSRTNALELTKSWPPCMRIILKETMIEKLKIGSLYIITCDGGTLGREGDHSIIIPDINVSKVHAKITFDKDSDKYVIVDLGSQNGTILNGKRISSAKQTSEPQEIVHGSIIQLGTTKLLCHIHDGQKTCGHCEPGLIQVENNVQEIKIIKPAKKSTQYKKELRRLKKKFGLETQDNSSEASSEYVNRAKERRDQFGSHNDHEKTQVASVDQSIAADNKGFKMLSKMGWLEGQALGKDGSGLTEPVPLISNEGTTGLGSSAPGIPAVNSSMMKKANVWKKAQQRYQCAREISLEAFKDSSSDEES
ncbi:uncharacterized protein CBL_04032 [Carabus blaptoides fortunei]